jgi:hypothetical protein
MVHHEVPEKYSGKRVPHLVAVEVQFTLRYSTGDHQGDDQ